MGPEVMLVRPADDRADAYVVPGGEETADPFVLEGLGMGYIAAYLRVHADAEVEIVDGTIDPVTSEDIVDYIARCNPRLVGFSVLLDGYPDVQRVVGALRERGFTGHITMGQHFATFNYAKIFADTPGIDSVVRFEGEHTALELLETLRRGGSLDGVAGLAFRAPDGTAVANTPRPLIEDLDSVPFPARDVLARNLDRVAQVSISGSRGCPWRCKFCSITTFYKIPKGRIWRHRSPQNIVDEMEVIGEHFSKRVFTFADDQFMGAGPNGRAFARSFAEEVMRRKLDIEFSFETRSDSIDREIFAQLRDAGLSHVFLGVESGYQPTLDFYRKDVTVERQAEAIRTLRDLGIEVRMGFIMFHEHSTLQEVRANLSFLAETESFSMTSMYGSLELRPGSAFMEEYDESADVNELYQGKWALRDPRTRGYKLALEHVLQPLATPMLYAHHRKRMSLLDPEVIAGAEARMRDATLAAATELLDIAMLQPLQSKHRDRVRDDVARTAAEIQMVLELADMLAGGPQEATA